VIGQCLGLQLRVGVVRGYEVGGSRVLTLFGVWLGVGM